MYNKKKIYFVSDNTKYISSRAIKISAFSLVLDTGETTDFSLHSLKCIWYSPQKSKYPLYIHYVEEAHIHANTGTLIINASAHPNLTLF